ncbi:MAG: hypothetical protein V4819_23360 [Verrucomicrobiota bacterium]
MRTFSDILPLWTGGLLGATIGIGEFTDNRSVNPKGRSDPISITVSQFSALESTCRLAFIPTERFSASFLRSRVRKSTTYSTIMKTILHSKILLVLLLIIPGLASASPQPEGYAGKIIRLDSKSVMVTGELGQKVFDIRKAGVCGWPTPKKVTDVFKTGDEVIIYHFGNNELKSPGAALNVFYADEVKTAAFQKQNPKRRAGK